MKPKTKKILIIAVAVAIVAVIAWLVFRKRNGNTATIISKLNADQSLKDKLTAMVSFINTGWSEDAKKQIAQKAAASNRSLAQQTVIEAAYALFDSQQIDATTYQTILNQLT